MCIQVQAAIGKNLSNYEVCFNFIGLAAEGDGRELRVRT